MIPGNLFSFFPFPQAKHACPCSCAIVGYAKLRSGGFVKSGITSGSVDEEPMLLLLLLLLLLFFVVVLLLDEAGALFSTLFVFVLFAVFRTACLHAPPSHISQKQAYHSQDLF